jgi:hypothetical protein
MLYIGVGSGMGYYAEVTEENNQQYPCFLNRFDGQHLVVLIDPCMESELKLFTYFASQADPLELVNQINWSNTDNAEIVSRYWTDGFKNTFPSSTVPLVREFANSRGTYFVINDCFYPQANPHMDRAHVEKSSESFSILCQLVTIALGKVRPSKIVYQDYTGADTTNCYASLFEIFGRENIVPNVCFDVTQQDGGCFIRLTPDMIQLDEYGHFVQEKYECLTKFTSSAKYLPILKTRIDALTYPTIWNYIKLKEGGNFEQVFTNRVKTLALLYGLSFNPAARHDVLLEQYLCIIKTVIRDIVRSREIDDSFADYLIGNLENRTEFINTISVLKFE